MTYIVSSGTLNPTIPYHTVVYDYFLTNEPDDDDDDGDDDGKYKPVKQ